MAVQNYSQLIAWQKAMEMVTMIYRVTKQFPKEEMYGLTSQIRRAAVSIPSNIAEGQARTSTKEFLQFLAVAQGSRAEVETQIQIALRLDYMTNNRAQEILTLLSEIRKLMYGLSKVLQRKL